MVGSFTKQALQVAYITDPRTKHVKRDHRKTRRICNGMDQFEAR
jgi:hypothetical protein